MEHHKKTYTTRVKVLIFSRKNVSISLQMTDNPTHSMKDSNRIWNIFQELPRTFVWAGSCMQETEETDRPYFCQT